MWGLKLKVVIQFEVMFILGTLSCHLSLIYGRLIKYQNGNYLIKFKQNTTESYDLTKQTKQIYFSELTALMSIIALNVSMCVCSGG